MNTNADVRPQLKYHTRRVDRWIVADRPGVFPTTDHDAVPVPALSIETEANRGDEIPRRRKYYGTARKSGAEVREPASV
jgi:hypothetical protein